MSAELLTTAASQIVCRKAEDSKSAFGNFPTSVFGLLLVSCVCSLKVSEKNAEMDKSKGSRFLITGPAC